MTREKKTRKDTRNNLMITAGRLFAEHGYDKVSTRKIADTAQVNLGGIHYHFGSKEKLYIEAFKFAVETSRAARFGQAVEEFPHLMRTPKGQAELVCKVAKDTFMDLRDSQEGAWVHEILLRELYFPSSAKETLAVLVFKPKMETTFNFFDQINPSFTIEEKLYFSSFIGSNALFYFATLRPYKVMFGNPFHESVYLKKVEQQTTKALLLLLGLPLPTEFLP